MPVNFEDVYKVEGMSAEEIANVLKSTENEISGLKSRVNTAENEIRRFDADMDKVADDCNRAIRERVSQEEFARILKDGELERRIDDLEHTGGGSADLSNLVDKSLYYYGDSSIIPTDEKYFNITEDGAISINEAIWDSSITDVVIPYEVGEIKVTKIADLGFQKEDKLSQLKRVIMPNCISSIGIFAFADCTGLTSINIPDSVTSIGNSVFSWCTSLTSITIPDSVTSIGRNILNQCNLLSSIIFKGSKPQWDAINIHDSNDILFNAEITFESDLKLPEIMDTDEFIELWNNTSDFELFAGKATEAKTMAVYLGQINTNSNHLNDLDERKSDKTTISTSSDTAYIFDLSDNYNKEIRLTDVLSSISFNIPTNPKDDYISSLSFSTGDVTIPIDYPSGGVVNWVGTDCSISDGISNFIPSPNKHYDIVFYYNGTSMVGMVNGFVPAEVVS